MASRNQRIESNTASRGSGPQNGRLAAAQGRTSRAEIEKRIRERAYILWEKRGRAHGFDRQDWTEAEKQIRREFQIS